MSRALYACGAGVLIQLATVGTVGAGPLDPPAGPITGTAKPLAEIEPRIPISLTNTPGDADSLFKITEPGSYYLTGNITGVAGKHGIEIDAPRVTIDLNGFVLAGVAGSLDGIVTENTNRQIVVRNGSLTSWGGSGINIPNLASMGVVEAVTSANNGAAGIRVGTSFSVSHCSSRSNVGTGISAGIYSTLLNCSASFDDGIGIEAASGSSVLNCASANSGGAGFDLGAGCTISGCSSIGSDGFGFETAQGCLLFACSVWNSQGGGFNVGIGNTVTNCSAHSNDGVGIIAAASSKIIDCSFSSNTLDGISVSSDCYVRGNTSDSNGIGTDEGAAIHVTGNDNRIEGNNCTDSDRGIAVDAAGNVIVRNTCSGNLTNWTIVANNVCGPILDRQAPASAAINGDSAPSSLGSTDANANYTY